MNRSLFCIFINYLNVEVDQLFQVVLKSKSLKKISNFSIAIYIIYRVVWTLRKFLYSTLILTVFCYVTFESPVQDTNISPGFENHNKKKKQKQTTTTKKCYKGPIPFFFSFNGKITQLLWVGIDHVPPPSKKK